MEFPISYLELFSLWEMIYLSWTLFTPYCTLPSHPILYTVHHTGNAHLLCGSVDPASSWLFPPSRANRPLPNHSHFTLRCTRHL